MAAQNPIWGEEHLANELLVKAGLCVAISVTFQLFYFFVVMEHGSRKVLHINVTQHPTAQWTRQQLREAIPADHAYRFLIHDRDSIFSAAFDESAERLGLCVLKTPYRSPIANAICERLIGTLRRECLDWVIPIGEKHLRTLVGDWRRYYSERRPHTGSGGSIPSPPLGLPVSKQATRHRLGAGQRVIARPVLDGLCYDYGLVGMA